MQIQLATIQDAEDIHRIHDEAVQVTCKDFYNEEQIRVWLEDRSPQRYHQSIKKRELFVGQLNKETIGYIHVAPGEIMSIFVDPNFQGLGLGKQLLDYGLSIAIKNHKKVKVQSTLNAEEFYKKNGFNKIRNDFHIIKGVKAPVIIMEYIVSKQSSSS